MRIPEAIICDRCKDDCSTLYVTAFLDDKQCTPAYEHHYCPECYEVLKKPIKAWMAAGGFSVKTNVRDRR